MRVLNNEIYSCITVKVHEKTADCCQLPDFVFLLFIKLNYLQEYILIFPPLSVFDFFIITD